MRVSRTRMNFSASMCSLADGPGPLYLADARSALFGAPVPEFKTS